MTEWPMGVRKPQPLEFALFSAKTNNKGHSTPHQIISPEWACLS